MDSESPNYQLRRTGQEESESNGRSKTRLIPSGRGQGAGAGSSDSFSLRVVVATLAYQSMLRLLLSSCLRRTSIMSFGGCPSQGPQRALFSVSAPRVSFSPPDCSLFDEPLAISVEDLRPQQEIALRASLEDESGVLFQSRAFYRADHEGRLDLRRSPALEGGTFSGLEPMGLLWSLQPQKPLRRLVKRDVERPFRLEVEVLESQGASLPDCVLAKGSHERRFLGEGVKRIPVREGRIRATLFQPPGTQRGR